MALFARKKLDKHPDLQGRNTTTEFMARRVLDGVAARLAAGELGASARGIQSLRVVLHESRRAWAAYESELSA